MDSEQRRYARVAGPFEGYRVGVMDVPVTIHDLSEGGCFVNSLGAAPAVGRTLALRIDLPGEGWIALKCQAVYVNPEFGFAVSFVNVPPEVENKLARVVAQRREEPGAS